jgi:4-amino-4-deoxy-L-arabinose transferase-like glycosyltransferase
MKPAVLAALAFAAFRFWFAGHIDLAPDEAYYWEWSRHLDWSYYDQGPMLALAIRLGTALCGSNEFGVRLMAVLAGLGVSLLLIHAVKKLGRPESALWLVLAANSLLLFSVGGVLMMHDSLMGFFWMAALVALLHALEKGGWRWLPVGLLGAGAILSKYTGGLFFAAALAALLSRPELRQKLRSPWPWAAALLGLAAAAAPILYWNRLHAWPSFAHVASLAGGDASRHSWATLPEFLASQFGLATPLLFVMVVAALWKARRQGAERSILFFMAALPLLFFLALSTRTRVEGNWPAQAYFAGLLLLALDLDAWGPWAKRALAVSFALTGLVYLQAAWPFLPLDARLDSAARVDGWRELGRRVGAEQAALGPQSFVAVRTYQNAAELAFYTPGQASPLILQDGVINHQYRFWNRPALYAGRDAVLAVGQAWELDEMHRHFKSVKPLPDEVFYRRGLEARRTRLYAGRFFLPEGK